MEERNKINYFEHSNKVIIAMKYTTFKGTFVEKKILKLRVRQQP